MTKTPIALVICVLSLQPVVFGQVDFVTCAGELDRLRRKARDAESVAQVAASADQQFAAKQEDFYRCRRNPKLYDLLNGDCSRQARDARIAASELDSATTNLQSSLDEVDRAIKGVAGSCGGASATSAVPIIGVTESNQSMCRLVRRYVNTLGRDTVLKTCRQSMSEVECGACLASQ